MIARYTDGTPVQLGDRIRYHQQPGGMMAPPMDAHGSIRWTEGVAIASTWADKRERAIRAGLDPDELELLDDSGGRFHIGPHVIERV